MTAHHTSLRVGVLGLNHKTADLVLREAIARGADALSGERARFFAYPMILLSTCNRTEIYFSGDDLSEAHGALLAFLRTCIEEPFEHRLYSYFGLDCFAHLAKVTAGLDSAILAETEIQRQVKVAYEKGARAVDLPSCLHYIFQKSLRIGKAIRNQFAIERGAPTLFQSIWEIGIGHVAELKSARTLLVGHSELNRALAFFLLKKGINGCSLITRSPATVRLSGCAIYDREELSRWAEYDLIICATNANEYLIRGAGIKKHLLFDLSVPRNVDPVLSEQPGVFLYNIEQLNQAIEKKRVAQADQLARSEELVWKQVVQMALGYRQRAEFQMAF